MENQLFLTEEGESKASIFFTLMMAFFIVIVSACFLRLLEYSLEGTAEVYAKTIEPDYAAEKYSKIKEIEMAPGERREIRIGFYNRGRYNWRQSGASFISVYTDKPHYRQSVFQDKSWYRKDQPAKLKDSLVGPAKLGYFEFYLQAPKKPGVYEEHFALAAENKLWIPNGQFTLKITVNPDLVVNQEGEEVKKEIIETAAPKIKTLNSRDYQARRFSRLEPLVLKPEEEAMVGVIFLNEGKKDWLNRRLILQQVKKGLSIFPSSFATDEWLDKETVLAVESQPVKPGQTDIYHIPLKGVAEVGVYVLHFNLIVNEGLIEGGKVTVPVMVNAEGLAPLDATFEPAIRIGLFTTEEAMVFISPFEYQIKDTAGQELAVLHANEEARLNFNEKEGIYTLAFPQSITVTTAAPLRLEPLAEDSHFVLSNYENLLRGNKKINDNKFRGALEISFNKETGYLWLINELPVEAYLKGLAEASESSPPEFQKALAVAARTYAYYHLQHPDKHRQAGFTLDADVDQVYRGLGAEERSAKWVEAMEATRGIIVTYQGEAVPTPYFARSDGRTRSWKEAWGGEDKPWLKSVKTPYDRGYSRLGHGVGMSAHDAIGRAKKGWLYEEILKYYYQGVEMMKAY